MTEPTSRTPVLDPLASMTADSVAASSLDAETRSDAVHQATGVGLLGG
jgi:hypothetical protein